MNPVDAVSLNVLENLSYTGGFTNHGDAISFCQGVFDPGQKNIIVQIQSNIVLIKVLIDINDIIDDN